MEQKKVPARVFTIIRSDAEINPSIITDLIVLDMRDYGIIFGMDCLSKYQATIYCKNKLITFQPFEDE